MVWDWLWTWSPYNSGVYIEQWNVLVSYSKSKSFDFYVHNSERYHLESQNCNQRKT